MSKNYGWYVVFVMAGCHFVSFLDRIVITLVIQPLKADLGMSDTEIGLVTGLGFAVLFAAFGLPMGRLADFMNRRLLIIGGVLFWSAATAMCGLTNSVPGLLLARIGVGLGEACLAPAAFSIITSYVPPEKLGRASSIFTLGASFGRTFGLIAGGGILIGLANAGGPPFAFLEGFKSWQILFFCAAVPGVVVAAFVLTIREPARIAASAVKAGGYTIRDTLSYIHTHRRAYYPYLLASSCLITIVQAMGLWTPTFLVRRWGLSPGESGFLLGTIDFIPSVISSFVAGWTADWLRTRGYKDAPNRVITAVLLTSVIPGLAFLLVPNFWVMQGFMLIYFMLSGMASGPALAGIQILTPPERRGVVSGVFIGLSNLAGFGLGPPVVGVLTDFVFRDEALLNYSMASALAFLVVLGAATAWFSRDAFIAVSAKAETREAQA